jgi:hypothetical protein
METTKHIFQVDRREINYLRVTIESYDGMAVVRTIDPHRALIEIQASPGCEKYIFDLLGALISNEGINITPINESDYNDQR